jgi:hypothetical protein
MVNNKHYEKLEDNAVVLTSRGIPTVSMAVHRTAQWTHEKHPLMGEKLWKKVTVRNRTENGIAFSSSKPPCSHFVALSHGQLNGVLPVGGLVALVSQQDGHCNYLFGAVCCVFIFYFLFYFTNILKNSLQLLA